MFTYQRRKDDPLRGLDHATRRRVRRSVRRGVAVEDPNEAPHAVGYADVVAARENPIPLGMPVVLAVTAAAGVAVFTGIVGPLWLLPFVVAIIVRPVQEQLVARARSAAEANRELAASHGVEVPDRPPPGTTWDGLTPWGVVIVIGLFFVWNVARGGLAEDPTAHALPPVEEETVQEEHAQWYLYTPYRCTLGANEIAGLSPDAPDFAARRFEIRSRVAADVSQGIDGTPARAQGAVTHLNLAVRHEEQALTLERKGAEATEQREKAAHHARVSIGLLQDLGVTDCDAVFG